MKKIIYTALMAASLFTFSGCESYLDVNTNPNGPDQMVMPHLYMSPILTEMALGIQFDGRYLGKYTANWHGQAADITWDRHGYAPGSDAAGQIWRSTYYTSGLNLVNMIKKAEEEKKWDFVAIGYALQAFNWQLTTDYHGEIIMSQAFDPTKSAFDYDSQEAVYAEVKRLAELALTYFEKHKAEPHPNSKLAEGDLMFGGNVAKWEKFTYGVLAINAHHLSNKPNYNPAKVIEYVDKSLASNADDATIRFNGAVSGDANFWGPMRGNLISPNVRQSKFIVGLLDGTNPVLRDATVDPVTEVAVPNIKDPVFTAQHLKDPRLPVMLSPAADGEYRGVGYGGVAEYTVTAQRPYNLYGTTSDAGAANATAQGKYLFQNAARFPIMTYAQMQFIKAEAAYKSGAKGVALEAYKKGVNAHMDFVRAYASATERTVFDQRRAAYMANTKLIPAAEANLTLSHIMLQKYVAQWAWGFVETWTDLRRYHYTGNESGGSYDEIDNDASDNVFRGFILPTDAGLQFYSTNGGKPAYRVRPRYNSEYVWNIEALRTIGGLETNYHTKEMWFSSPQ
ncbi:hypothetical protein ABID22_000844 [Pontibacter aydingkolensis]|uniref:SusD/RagB family nutrient-binding outer membrane lipoprotein n=1 Tax=Pontibacter aydingkolensis TaxID=1911536 RepID=A0ABS7CSS8_9BACT|nr:SusD/RagB family nutrient-binding outer membrane lipoprotein [Pontibacter aydingkolensis]MBW7466904.1 SusD/RagB family nutrient-binding outer membrane lipoprotein [Pontibacter aydingkolensis]